MDNKKIIIYTVLKNIEQYKIDYDKLSDEIMNLIRKNNIEYTTNNNGFFINISLLEEDIIDSIIYIINNYNININTNDNMYIIDNELISENNKISSEIMNIKKNKNKNKNKITEIDDIDKLVIKYSKVDLTI